MRRWPSISATTSTTRPAGTGATPATGNGPRRCSPTAGEVEIEVPRDRDGSFEPQIVEKRQRRLSSIDEIVLSLYARGLTTGEISAHFADIYDAHGVQGHHPPDHRPGDRGDAGLDQPAAGAGLRRDVHRRDHGEGPRRPGRATGPSTPRSGSTSTATRTSSGCGPATATASRRSSGWRC